MQRLTRAAEVSLPILKWVLVLGLLANFSTLYLWWDFYDYADFNADAKRKLWSVLYCATFAGFMIQSLPGERLVNMVTRTTALAYLSATLWFTHVDADVRSIELPLEALPFILPTVALIVGGIAYVATVRPNVSWPFGGGKQ